MRQWFLFLITIIMTGCAHHSDSINLEPYTKLSCNSISILTPNSYQNFPWWTWQINADKIIAMKRHIPNMMSEDVSITVGSPENLKNSTEKFFIKDFDYEKWAQEVLNRPDIVANMKERGVSYSKKYVDYIGGLKCGTDVESSTLALGVGSKRYYTVCGYYDTVGAKKRVDILYDYTYTHSGTKHDNDTKSSSITPEAMQHQFKQDMKAIFDSLVIHDMDRERMSKEGLLHDKQYNLESEFR